MSTDFQRAREALGARLQQLRRKADLTGRELAARLAWPPSKVSKLETGRQTAAAADLTAWASAVGRPEIAEELVAELEGLETSYRSWRRALGTGHAGVQSEIRTAEREYELVRAYEPVLVPGLLQIPEYAHAVFTANAELRQSARDTDAAVMERMRRQDVLYLPGRKFEFLVGETALRSLICPRPVLVAQIHRLIATVGLPSVSLGILPLGAPMPLGLRHSFWIKDDRAVTVETIGAQQHLDRAADVALYLRAWEMYSSTAVYGVEAQRLLAAIGASLAA